MTNFELRDTDPEDIEDLLAKVETSFDIKFKDGELVHIETFGQFCDHIANKILLDNSDDCTSQQAFYKLRHGLASTLTRKPKDISPDLLLIDLFPRHSRRKRVKSLERHLGFKLQLLRPPRWLTSILIIVFLASIVAWFFKWQAGLIGTTSSIILLWLSGRVGNELDERTVGDLAERMTRDNYLKSRRDAKTFNKNEIENILTDIFSAGLYLDKSALTRDALLR